MAQTTLPARAATLPVVNQPAAPRAATLEIPIKIRRTLDPDKPPPDDVLEEGELASDIASTLPPRLWIGPVDGIGPPRLIVDSAEILDAAKTFVNDTISALSFDPGMIAVATDLSLTGQGIPTSVLAIVPATAGLIAAGTDDVQAITSLGLRSQLGNDVAALNSTFVAANRMVVPALNYLADLIAAATGAVTLVGVYDVASNLISPGLNSPVGGVQLPLPLASVGNQGWYVIVSLPGSGSGNAPSGSYAVGDWLISTGSEWLHFEMGLQALAAANVNVSPIVGLTSTNVQTSLEQLDHRISTFRALPPGGRTNDILAKRSNNDQDVGWGFPTTNLSIGNNALLSAFSQNLATANVTQNTALGNMALYSLISGDLNVGVGDATLASLENGRRNIALGVSALAYLVSGQDNVALGSWAGGLTGTVGVAGLTVANSSLYLGNNTRPRQNNAQNEIVIGNNAWGFGDNTISLGNNSATELYTNAGLAVGFYSPGMGGGMGRGTINCRNGYFINGRPLQAGGAMTLVGSYDIPGDEIRPGLNSPAAGTPPIRLPAPSTANQGWYVIIPTPGNPPIGSEAPSGSYALGDWLVSTGGDWLHFEMGLGAITASGVGVTQINSAPWANVQTALEGLHANIGAIHGVSVGGNVNDVLTKIGTNDDDYGWVALPPLTAANVSAVPTGFAATDVQAALEEVYALAAAPGLPAGGVLDDVLIKRSATDGDAVWTAAPWLLPGENLGRIYLNPSNSGPLPSANDFGIWTNLLVDIIGPEPPATPLGIGWRQIGQGQSNILGFGRVNGTLAAPVAIGPGAQQMFNLAIYGWTGGEWVGGASIAMQNMQPWTAGPAGQRGSQLRFSAAGPGDSQASVQLTISNGVYIGDTTIGASNFVPPGRGTLNVLHAITVGSDQGWTRFRAWNGVVIGQVNTMGWDAADMGSGTLNLQTALYLNSQQVLVSATPPPGARYLYLAP